MKELPATKGFVALVDDEDFEFLSQFRYCATGSRGPRPALSARSHGYRSGEYLARMLMRPPPGMVVDHINGDPWDNRRCNLRVCTVAENNRNTRGRRNSKAPYKGITRLRGRWQAQIRHNSRLRYLGIFHDPEDAARAYDAAAILYHGEFACVNFPDARNDSCRSPRQAVSA